MQLISTARNSALFALALAVAAVGFYQSYLHHGVPFWFLLAAAFVAATSGLGLIALALAEAGETVKVRRQLQNAVLLIASLTLIAVCSELFLAWAERSVGARPAQVDAGHRDHPLLLPGTLAEDAHEIIAERRGVVTLPSAWKRQAVMVPGSKRSYRWHEAVHVHDQYGFRRTQPFPSKQPDTLRVLVVGDSLTYGYGIAERHTYTKIAQDRLGEEFEIELLNLGVSGYQSEDVLKLLRRFVPELKPDLVFYGVCLNDFLPSAQGQHRSTAYAIPIPSVVKTYLEAHTRLARLLAALYDRALMSLGLRPDFMDDIVSNFGDYQARFGRDVAAIGEVASEHGGIPVVGMVLHQFPEVHGRGHRAALIAEKHLRDAGFQVIGADGYFQAYDGRRDLHVSPWEGHPNELANALYASLLIEALREHSALDPYRKSE